MSDEGDWLRSKALLTLLSASGRDLRKATDQLRTGLLNGYIRAKAIHTVVTKPWPAKTGEGHVIQNADVPAGLWAGMSGNSELDLAEDVFWSNGQTSATGFHTVRITGIFFAKSDVAQFLDLAGASAELPPSQLRQPATGPTESLGRLPPSAKPADRRDEQYAHEAARLVRGGLKLSDALRQVAPSDPTRSDASIEHGIRRTFGLMYQSDGRAIQP